MAATFDQNFKLNIGEDRTITITVTDAAGAAVDIGGATPINWVMTTHPLSGAAATLTKTGAIVGDGSAGQFTVTIADTDTDALNPGIYYHEAKVTDSGSNETVTTTGRIRLEPSQT